ncbi:MAG: hypothetical protein LUC45_00865 [Paraprevotella sp.]|nr:hypothetical protein [Paraprevotella sp.]
MQNTYSNYPAYFVCKNVMTVPQLNAAMNSLGVYATIRYDRERFLFTDENGNTTPVNATAIAGNASLQMGIAGFIVGLPNIPELGSSISVPVCYDLACPNCYSSYNISRALQLKEGGYASCTSCNRIYNLNNQGQISSGDGGVSLFRYRINYSGNTVVINNR